MNNKIFRTEQHEQRFNDVISRMKYVDSYHASLAYLLALDENINDFDCCFDFAEDCIKPDVMNSAWVTGTDRRVLELAFHLWNEKNPANISDVFSCGGYYLDYLLEAVRIRFQ